MDENTFMVDVAKYFMNFLQEGVLRKMLSLSKGDSTNYEILDDITTGRGTLESLDLLEELATTVQDTRPLCGFGTTQRTRSSPLSVFPDEYSEHILHKRCLWRGL